MVRRLVRLRILVLPIALGTLSEGSASAQPDPVKELNQRVLVSSGNVFGFTFEERTRWEQKTGVNFGKSVDQQDMLSRIRIGAEFEPMNWLRIYAMGQDSRAPFYGTTAPNTVRDTIDIQEGYIELFAKRKSGFGAIFGRQMLTLGEGRLIGSPQWVNVARTFDTGRLFYQVHKTRIEALLVSPVKILPDSFNKPEFGERLWGTYGTFTSAWNENSIDLYVLRHSQNKSGGWTGPGTLGTNSFGGRLYGPLPLKFAYSLEALGQTGHIGLLTQRAYAWYASVSRKVTLFNRAFNMSVEYRTASGTQPNATVSGTYDQLSAANHDRFGHEDLFGWRNLRTFRNLDTLNVTKTLAINVMYSNERLFSATDALYNILGSPISISPKGIAGKYVGQEIDSFVTWQKGSHLFGAGFGHFFKGEFVVNTTPHINPRYFYVFQQYSFK